MQGMSEREYSAHSKLSRGAIQKAKRNGRMVLFGDGSVKGYRLTPVATIGGMEFQVLHDDVVRHISGCGREIPSCPDPPAPVALAQVLSD